MSTTIGAVPAAAGHLTVGGQRPAGGLHTLAAPSGRHERLGQQALATSDAGAGINRYWEYEEHAIPGIGKAMLNVGTGNLVIQATDLAIPERGLGLVFQRTYNSQSLHDANGDDGAEPNIFGNGWTNNYDAHIVYQTSTGDISVYDIDGTRCDYTPSAGGWLPCAGEHATLEVDPNTACAYWWIKKNGTAYWFHSDDPGPGCSFGQGETGRLYKIVGRNSNNAITLNYSFSGSQTSENITEIDVNHSDGQSLTMLFGKVNNGTGPNELTSITLPDGTAVSYAYDAQGDLDEVERPGNDKTNNPDPLPETYGVQHPIQFACGPRATNYKQNGGGFADGACLNFDYDSNVRLIDWKVNGVLNINPSNYDPSETYGVLQPGMPTGWQTWYMASFVYGAGEGTACGTTLSGNTTMCDSDGHSTIWSVDSIGRVTQTQDYVSSSLSLVTNQTWDPNNNLVAFVDANNHESDYAYDSYGNTIAVRHPAPASGSSHPTEVYAYDGHNNLTAYCDPIYSDQHGLDWNSGSWPGTQCPGGAGTTHYTWATPSPEPYGQLTDAYTACYNANCTDPIKNISEPGYHVSYTYNNNGLPTQVKGDTISQPSGARTPVQAFGYDTYGNLKSYTSGDNGTWQLNYDALNRLTSRVDPDSGNPTSYFYYFADGSLQMSETPYQHSVGKGRTYTYDADGDMTTEVVHRKGTSGTIWKIYDGLDRLVDVIEPHDSSYDALQNAWITRYLYDLTEGGTVTFNGSPSFSAYGNLFETEEVLPTGTSPNGTTLTYNGSTLNNNQVVPQKGTQYDALDRPVGAYSIVNGGNALTTSTYDGHNEYGLLTHQCKPDPTGGQNPLCKTFYHDNDDRLTSVNYNDKDSTVRQFTYDLAGHKLTATKTNDDQETYWYDLEGRVVATQEPNIGTSSPSKYTHEFYADGKLKQLDVTSGQLNQTGLYAYTYDDAGRITNQTIEYDSANINVNVALTYTLSGRPLTRTETGSGAHQGGAQTSWGYDPYGQLASTAYPMQSPITDYQYDPEGDLLTFNGTSYSYSIRGELLGPQGEGQFALSNGAQVQTPQPPKSYASAWNDRMGVMTQLVTDPGLGDESTSTYAYDAAGRETGEGSDSCTGQCNSNTIVTTGTSRMYDIDDHTLDTKQWWSRQATIGGKSSANVSVYDWGPTDHPIRIGSADSTTSTPPDDSSATFDTLHWDGDQLIFSTNAQNKVDDVKVGSSADITFNAGYAGITFWDRGPGGAVVYCHNTTGSGGSGQIAAYPIWMGWYSSPCFSFSNPPAFQYPTNIEWFTGPEVAGTLSGQPRVGGVGQGFIVGMYRPDGISDGANNIQGVRTTDSSTGAWTTPDAFAGILSDPTTQKSYVWAGSNPLAYSDPSGYAIVPHLMASFDAGFWVNAADCDGAGCSSALEMPDDGGNPDSASGTPAADTQVAQVEEEGGDESEKEVQEAADPSVDFADSISNPISDALDDLLLSGSGRRNEVADQRRVASNAVRDHLTRKDIAGAIKQFYGYPSGGNHVAEVREAIQGLQTRAARLTNWANQTSNPLARAVMLSESRRMTEAATFYIDQLSLAGASGILK